MPADFVLHSQCGEVCLIFGIAFAPLCILEKAHNGEHMAKVTVQSPEFKFRIFWSGPGERKILSDK